MSSLRTQNKKQQQKTMPESLNLMKFANAKSADADLFSGFMQGFIDLVIIMKKGVLLLN